MIAPDPTLSSSTSTARVRASFPLFFNVRLSLECSFRDSRKSLSKPRNWYTVIHRGIESKLKYMVIDCIPSFSQNWGFFFRMYTTILSPSLYFPSVSVLYHNVSKLLSRTYQKFGINKNDKIQVSFRDRICKLINKEIERCQV